MPAAPTCPRIVLVDDEEFVHEFIGVVVHAYIAVQTRGTLIDWLRTATG